MRLLALLLTTLTGFSGLVYEVTWQKYLATLLGSHSEATSAVLAIFLGGLAVGYALFGALTRRWVERAEQSGEPPRLLFIYGVLEGGIGLYAFVFPLLFQLVYAFSYAVPHGAGGLGFAFDVLLAAVLIGPPTVLMGATIPILTQALAHDLEDATRFHAYVYGFNTIGAFVGALAAGFVLIPMLGLFKVMVAMGVVNLAAGAVFLWLGRDRRAGVLPEVKDEMLPPAVFTTYAAVALLTGFAMMTVQTAVIRVGGLSFGSSEHTFAMVVAVFVLCIAIGSFAVSAVSRIPRWVLPAALFVLVVLLCALYTLLPEAPYWIHVVRTWFRDDAASFYPFHAFGFLAVGVAIAPSVLVSGAVLPLIFDHLRHQVDDLGSVAGKLYSWNTVGSLLGALFGGYVLFFFFDLDTILRLAIVAIFVSAVWLAGALYGSARAAVAGALILVVAIGSLASDWDPRQLTTGLFRAREPMPLTGAGPDAVIELAWEAENYELLFHEDDPTMTVTVMEQRIGGRAARSIVNNGKSDGNSVRDLSTMVLAAALPSLYAERVESAFVIGYGTGITAGELASYESMESVVVAEISPGVMNAAPFFDDVNHAASKHPKIEIVRSDAHRALMRSDRNFDVIVSEPSNPWVTGVEMLYSREYLQAISNHLSDGGVFAQWLQNYEIDQASIEMVLRTFLAVFEDVSIWQVDADMILLGSNRAFPADLFARVDRRIRQRDIGTSVARTGVTSLPALFAHEVVPAGVLSRAGLEGPLHTLSHPRLAHLSGRAFYRGAKGSLPFTGFGEPASAGRSNALLHRLAARSGGALGEVDRARATQRACAARPKLCVVMLAEWQALASDSVPLNRLKGAFLPATRDDYLRQVDELVPLFDTTASGPVNVAFANRALEKYRSEYEHLAPFRPQALMSIWRRCQAPANDPGACRRGMDEARTLLTGKSD